MKAQVLLISLLVIVAASSAKAGNNNNDPKQQQEQKKTVKPKYDFNIFKFFSIPAPQVDSLKPITTPSNKKSLFFTEKHLRTPKKTSLTI